MEHVGQQLHVRAVLEAKQARLFCDILHETHVFVLFAECVQHIHSSDRHWELEEGGGAAVQSKNRTLVILHYVRQCSANLTEHRVGGFSRVTGVAGLVIQRVEPTHGVVCTRAT